MPSRAYQASQTASEATQRLLADVHDSLGQELVALQLHLAAVTRRIEAGGPVCLSDMADVTKLADRALATLCDITRGAAFARAEDGNLSRALAALALRTSVAGLAEIHWESHVGDAVVKELPSTVTAHAYRLAQEAVANALRHSNARRIVIRLRDLGGSLSLAVTDDGIGFDTTARGPGIGLRSMHERARWLGGELSIRSLVDHGTTVECVWPITSNRRRHRRSNGDNGWRGVAADAS